MLTEFEKQLLHFLQVKTKHSHFHHRKPKTMSEYYRRCAIVTVSLHGMCKLTSSAHAVSLPLGTWLQERGKEAVEMVAWN